MRSSTWATSTTSNTGAAHVDRLQLFVVLGVVRELVVTRVDHKRLRIDVAFVEEVKQRLLSVWVKSSRSATCPAMNTRKSVAIASRWVSCVSHEIGRTRPLPSRDTPPPPAAIAAVIGRSARWGARRARWGTQPLLVGAARDIHKDLRPGDGIEIVEGRANGSLGRLDLLCALSVLLPCVERATRDRRAESEHAQDSRVEDPTEQEGEQPSGADRHRGSFTHWTGTGQAFSS